MVDVWQVAAGDVGRDYSSLFLAHDLMFIGPGYAGPYDPARYQAEVDAGELSDFKSNMIALFSSGAQPGDLVLLRRGHRVVALGLVPDEGYRHDVTFDDVHGWSLEHTRRVVWQHQLEEALATIQAARPLFAGRKQIPMFTRVGDAAVLDPIRDLIARVQPRPLRARPPSLPPPLTLEQLGSALFARGLAHGVVERVQTAIQRQRRLLEWYRLQGEASGRPDEHEVVAHMILPLLLALGWSEQLLAVEWKKVDLAGFSGTPTTAARCVMVCEAKGLWHGLQNVREQAVGYVDKLGLSACRQLVLTQGGRFYVHTREADKSWSREPTGYLNVESIRTSHVAPANTDALATLLALAPGGA